MSIDDLVLDPVAPPLALRVDADRSDLCWLEQRTRGIARGDIDHALRFAADLHLPHPGRGRTRLLWESLATIGAVDLQVARVVEPHLDALAILDQAGFAAPQGATFGVFAAEGGPQPLRARRDSADASSWRLDGVKPWCSLASRLSHALMTAWIDDDERGLFLVSLRDDGVHPADGPWLPAGLPDVVSASVTFDDVVATPVGSPGWYLQRPGFWWGGIGVAAIWYGATVGLSRTLLEAAGRRTPDQIALTHLGGVDVALHTARTVLFEAARAVDGGRATGREGALLGMRARQCVADHAEAVLSRVAHALGPAPLVADATHAHRVADLELYLRQHHAERDLAALGHLLVEEPSEEGP